MILPGFEAEAERGQLGKPLAEFRVAHQVRGHDTGCMFLDRVVLVPRDAVADAAEPAAAGRDLRLQHLAHPPAQGQVGVADDALGDPARAVPARGAHRRDAVDELDLADRRHLGGAGLPIHRAAFEKDGGDDVVSALDVGQQFGQQIAPALRRVPEMMMRVDDRQIRLQCRFARPLRQPCLQLGIVTVGEPAIFALRISGHVIPPRQIRWAIGQAHTTTISRLLLSGARGGLCAPERRDHFLGEAVEVFQLDVERGAERRGANHPVEPGIALLDRL